MSYQPVKNAPRKNDPRRLGIFGGTFDPVHLGHLICADQLGEALDLDLILFVPTNRQPHKPETEPASAGHRLAMIRLAIADHERFGDSDLEIRRGGVSYTVDTIAELRESFGRDVEFWLLMGQDSFAEIPTWKEPDRIATGVRPGQRCRMRWSDS
jgi:nicotinate-nucleotide adenylyltransferase